MRREGDNRNQLTSECSCYQAVTKLQVTPLCGTSTKGTNLLPTNTLLPSNSTVAKQYHHLVAKQLKPYTIKVAAVAAPILPYYCISTLFVKQVTDVFGFLVWITISFQHTRDVLYV